MLLLVSGALFNLTAQVTIGSDKVPETFSVLELISNDARGMRLPQLSAQQRNDLEASPDFQSHKSDLAKGLAIFNTNTNCVNTLNPQAKN